MFILVLGAFTQPVLECFGRHLTLSRLTKTGLSQQSSSLRFVLSLTFRDRRLLGACDWNLNKQDENSDAIFHFETVETKTRKAN